MLVLAALVPGASALLPLPGDECGGTFLAPGRCAAWTAREDSGGEDEGRAVALSPAGDVAYTAGLRQADAGFWDREAVVVAHDVATGARRWVASVASPYDGPNEFFAVHADASRVLAAGWAHDGSSSVFHLDFLVAMFDAETGATLWTTTLDLAEADRAFAVALSADASRAYAVGTSSLGEEGTRAVALALDGATGDVLWTTEKGTGRTNEARDVALAADGLTLYVGGTLYGGPGAIEDFGVLALDALTGEELWSARYDGPAGSADYGEAIAVDEARVVIVGSSEGVLDPWGDVAAVALDARTGAEEWVFRYAGTGLHWDGANDVALAGGRAFVAGTVHNLAQPFVPYVVAVYTPAQPAAFALDAEGGVMLWHHIDGGNDNIARGEGLALAASPEGDRVYVVGRTIPSGGSTDALALAYGGEDGTLLWRGTHTSPPSIYDTAAGVALTPGGERVVVAGLAGAGEASAYGGGGAGPDEEPHGDILTLAFDA